VSKRVPSEILFDSKLLRFGPDVLPQDRLPSTRFAATAATTTREYPVPVLAVLLMLLPFSEELDDEWMNRNGLL
jgi:hypothetical protein